MMSARAAFFLVAVGALVPLYLGPSVALYRFLWAFKPWVAAAIVGWWTIFRWAHRRISEAALRRPGSRLEGTLEADRAA